MKVWRIDYDIENFRRLTLVDDIDYIEFMHSFDGVPKKDGWSAPKMEYMEEDLKLPIGDFTPFGSGILTVADKIADKFQECFGGAIEVLKIESVKGISIIHIMDVCGCVDYERSLIDYYPDQVRIMDIDKYVFLKEVVESKTIFKDSGFPVTDVYVTDRCKQEIESWNPTGVMFIEYWDSEN